VLIYTARRLATLSKRAFPAFSSTFFSASAFAFAASALAFADAFSSIFDTLAAFAASTSTRRLLVSAALHSAAAACLALTCFSAAILAIRFAVALSAAFLAASSATVCGVLA